MENEHACLSSIRKSVVDIQNTMIEIPTGMMPIDLSAPTDFRRIDYSGKTVDKFQLAKFTVTMADWIEIMDYLPDDTEHLFSENPVINVNWVDVHRYIDRLNTFTGEKFRLPTDLEWEYAARAGYSGDRFFSKNVNFNRKRKGPIRVGMLPDNPWGLFEILGNVWEWVSDSGQIIPAIGRNKAYELKVLRGGCWSSRWDDVSLNSFAEHNKETSGWGSFGFRIAKSCCT